MRTSDLVQFLTEVAGVSLVETLETVTVLAAFDVAPVVSPSQYALHLLWQLLCVFLAEDSEHRLDVQQAIIMVISSLVELLKIM